MVSSVDSRSSGLGSSPGREHWVLFLGKLFLITLALPLLTQVYKWVLANLIAGGNPAMDPGGSRNTPGYFML